MPTEPFAAPSPTTLFIDKNVKVSQASAIQSAIAGYFGSVPVQRSRIVYKANGGTYQEVRVGNILTYKIRSKGKQPVSEVSDYLYPWLSGASQGETVYLRYASPQSAHVEFAQTNALNAQFSFSNP
jgi:hypothetical protein